MTIGYANTSHVNYALSGTGVINAQVINVAYAGQATMTQTGGQANVSWKLSLGDSSPLGTGTYNLSGGMLSAQNITVGNTGTGIFNQSGGLVTAPAVYASMLTIRAAGNGTYNMTGGTLNYGALVNNGAFNQTGGVATFAGNVTGNGTLFVSGASRFTSGSVALPQLTVGPAATVTLRPLSSGQPGSVVQQLDIASAPGGWAGKLDLNHSMVVDYSGPSPLSVVTSQVKSGFAGGAWGGTGITSNLAAQSTSTGHRLGLGVAEASDLVTAFPTTFAGRSIDSTSVLIKVTPAGDANLDGTVDLTDFTYLAANFNGTGKRWTQGDYNYDGSVDLADFTFLAANFNYAMPATTAAAVAFVAPVGTTTPEPAGLAAVLGTTALFGRGRRRR
jgi:hypothetical protein